MVRIAVDDQATSKLGGISSNVKSSMASVAKASAKAMGAAVAAAGAGAAAIGKSALDAYASYEQLSGGVEKLFGNASGTLMGFAQEAYKTTGLSANQYMEQVTGFSAALINSLGGDTEAAAKQADVAMRAISDNVNTFGSDVESVTGAFQGFAKQQYNMLDNLRLGYGGSRTEMERLIADANEYAAANGMAADLTIESFSDIVTAIELIQEKQGIAGTTSREAATTIEGSINMTRAAWRNLLTEFGKEDGDVGARITELIDSAMMALNNIMPRIQVIFQSIAEALPTYMPVVLDVLVNQVFPTLIEAVNSILPMLLEVLAQVLVMIAEQLPLLVETLVPVIVGLAPTMLDAALQMFLGILEALAESGPQIIDGLIDMLIDLIDKLPEYLPKMAEAALEFFWAIGQAIIERGPEILQHLLITIAKLVVEVGNAAGQVFDAAVEFMGGLLGGIASEAGNVVNAIGDVIMGGIRSIGQFFSDMYNAGGDLVQGLINGIASNIGAVIDTIVGGLEDAVDAALSFLGIHSPSRLFAWMGDMTMEGMAEGIEDTASKAEKAMRKAADGIYGAAEGDVSIESNFGAKGVAGSVGKSTAVSINVEKMEVRDERDIKAIADELYRLMNRQSGGAIWNSSYSAV